MLAFSNDYYGLNFRAKQSVELFCAYVKAKGSIQQYPDWNEDEFDYE